VYTTFFVFCNLNIMMHLKILLNVSLQKFTMLLQMQYNVENIE